MRAQLQRLFAFGTSLSIHLLLAATIGPHTGTEGAGASSQASSSEMLSVYLKKPERLESASAIRVAKSNRPKEIVHRFRPERPRPAGQAHETLPLVPLSGTPEPHYFRVSELTEKPRVLRDIPADPGEAVAGIPAQTAVLRLLISESGDIDRVVIEESYFPEQVAQAVMQAFSKIKFRPGQIGNMRVRSQLRIEVKLESTFTTN